MWMHLIDFFRSFHLTYGAPSPRPSVDLRRLERLKEDLRHAGWSLLLLPQDVDVREYDRYVHRVVEYLSLE